MWETTKLEKVCKIISGNSIPAKKKEEDFTGVEGMPYVATKDVGFDGSINYENGVYIPDEYRNNFKTSPVGATLVCAEGGSAGRKIAFSNKDCCFVNKLFSLQPDKNIIPKFIYYYTLSSEFQSQFKEAMHGLIGGVSLSKIKGFSISVPPLAEQQRIVAKLDAAFAEIEKLHCTSIAKLESLKVSIQRHRDILFSTGDATGVEWKSYVLSELLSSQPKNGKSPPKELQSDEGTPLLTLSAITGNVFTPSDSIFTKASVDATASYWIENGDLLITRANTRKLVGHVAIVHGIKNPMMFPDIVMKMRVNEQLASVQFIHQYLMTTLTREYIEKNAKGANPSMVKINQETVKKIPLRLPPIGLQSELYKEFSRVESEIRSLSAINLQKLNATRRLKSAILAQELQSEAA